MANLKVVFWSDWFGNPYNGNPYQFLLISNLEKQGVQIERYKKKGLIFLPQIIKEGIPDIVHFHALPIPIIWRKPVVQFFKLCLLIPEKIPDGEVQIYMKACDCVVIPYKVFTTSGVAILAMSFGRACIAPRIGFFNDILDDSGSFLYDSTDENGLLQAMRCAIENQDNLSLSDMGKHNLELAKQWNWKYVAEETYKIYQGCFEQ